MMDERPQASWSETTRARRVLVVADVVESVRLMDEHEADFIRRWRRFVGEVQAEVLPQRNGRLVKSLGDGFLLEFMSVPAAVSAALDLQDRIESCNVGYPRDQAMCLRIGAHVADVVVDALDIYGTGVNLAKRLAELALPGQVIASPAVRDQMVPGFDADAEDMGLCYLKHLDEPVHAYRLTSSTRRGAAGPLLPCGRSLRPVLAVIPFDTPGVDGVQAHVGDAVADELIAQLSRSPEITVVSRLSTMKLKGRDDVMCALRTMLHADYVISGTLRLHGERLHLGIELAEVSSELVIWSKSLQACTVDIVRGDDGVLHQLARDIGESLVCRQVERAVTQPMSSLESYCLLMAAVSLLHDVSLPRFERAREMLEVVIERERRHPAAYAWLAKWHVMRVQQGWTSDMRRESLSASDCTRQALDLNPHLPLSLTIDGFVHCNLLKDLDGAESRYRLALAENPNEPLAWLLLGTLHAFRGEGESALQATAKALELSPLDPMRYFFESLSATAALAAGEYERCIAHAKQSLRLHRTHTSTLRAMAIAQVQLDRLDEARKTVRELLKLEPGFTIRKYLSRTPSAGYSTGKLWSESLQAAGVPAQ